MGAEQPPAVVKVVDVLVVEVVPRSAALTGDAWAWAGTMTESTTGLIHRDGRRMVTVRPPTVKISSARRRVNSVIKCPPNQNLY
jgi:hypothetical protein